MAEDKTGLKLLQVRHTDPLTVESVMADNYVFIGRETSEDGLTSEVYLSRKAPAGFEIDTNGLHIDVIQGLRWARMVDERCMHNFTLKICPEMPGVAFGEQRVGTGFLNSRPEARSAATLHEVLHAFEEDSGVVWGGNVEAIPIFAEFLFTRGEGRLEYFFQLFDGFLKGESTEHHVIAWQCFIGLLEEGDIGSMTSEERYRAILAKKKALKETEKIALIKQVIQQAAQESSGQV